jgi:beta-phosphoglucomutase
VFLLAAKKLGLSPSVCLVVEDGLSGIQAAKKGGFFSAGIGPMAESDLPDYRLAKLSDVLPLVK